MQYILFPLGNPDHDYGETRHNAGRLVLAQLLRKSEFKNLLEEYGVELFIPEKTFMNESGRALKNFLRYHKVDPEKVIIMYDDKDLEVGEVRLAFGNSAGGHNGVKDIIENLGTPNFYRIRLGVAPVGTGKNGVIPPHGERVQRYVLEKFLPEEKHILLGSVVLEKVEDFLREILEGKVQN